MTQIVSSFQPDWVSPPGSTISVVMSQRDITQVDLADYMGQPVEWVEGLIDGQENITHEIAMQLQEFLGASAAFWLNRENQYREGLAQQNKETSATEPKEWLRALPVKDMIAYGWIKGSRNVQEKVQACLDFFGTSDIPSWHTKYSGALEAAAFRTSEAFEQKPASVVAWLRQGEREAAGIECNAWNPEGFKKALPIIRKLTRIKEPAIFMPKLQKICANVGVVVLVVRPPTGCRASGVTRFLDDTKALIMLSFRHKTDDHFWFTFFHEAAHLLLHTNEGFFLEEENNGFYTDEEEEADQFAENILIPMEHQNALAELRLTYKDIIRFAVQLGITPGIIVGQLQHKERLPHGKLNSLNRRFTWAQNNITHEMQ